MQIDSDCQASSKVEENMGENIPPPLDGRPFNLEKMMTRMGRNPRPIIQSQDLPVAVPKSMAEIYRSMNFEPRPMQHEGQWNVAVNSVEGGNSYFAAVAMMVYGNPDLWFWIKVEHLQFLEVVLRLNSKNGSHPRHDLYKRLNEVRSGPWNFNLEERLHVPDCWVDHELIAQITADLYGFYLIIYTHFSGREGTPSIPIFHEVYTRTDARGDYSSPHRFIRYTDKRHYTPVVPLEHSSPWEFRISPLKPNSQLPELQNYIGETDNTYHSRRQPIAGFPAPEKLHPTPIEFFEVKDAEKYLAEILWITFGPPTIESPTVATTPISGPSLQTPPASGNSKKRTSLQTSGTQEEDENSPPLSRGNNFSILQASHTEDNDGSDRPPSKKAKKQATSPASNIQEDAQSCESSSKEAEKCFTSQLFSIQGGSESGGVTIDINNSNIPGIPHIPATSTIGTILPVPLRLTLPAHPHTNYKRKSLKDLRRLVAERGLQISDQVNRFNDDVGRKKQYIRCLEGNDLERASGMTVPDKLDFAEGPRTVTADQTSTKVTTRQERENGVLRQITTTVITRTITSVPTSRIPGAEAEGEEPEQPITDFYNITDEELQRHLLSAKLHVTGNRENDVEVYRTWQRGSGRGMEVNAKDVQLRNDIADLGSGSIVFNTIINVTSSSPAAFRAIKQKQGNAGASSVDEGEDDFLEIEDMVSSPEPETPIPVEYSTWSAAALKREAAKRNPPLKVPSKAKAAEIVELLAPQLEALDVEARAARENVREGKRARVKERRRYARGGPKPAKKVKVAKADDETTVGGTDVEGTDVEGTGAEEHDVIEDENQTGEEVEEETSASDAEDEDGAEQDGDQEQEIGSNNGEGMSDGEMEYKRDHLAVETPGSDDDR